MLSISCVSSIHLFYQSILCIYAIYPFFLSILFYSILFYSILFCSFPCCSILFYSILFYRSILFHLFYLWNSIYSIYCIFYLLNSIYSIYSTMEVISSKPLLVFQVCFWERRKLQLVAAFASKLFVVRYSVASWGIVEAQTSRSDVWWDEI